LALALSGIVRTDDTLSAGLMDSPLFLVLLLAYLVIAVPTLITLEVKLSSDRAWSVPGNIQLSTIPARQSITE
jgi:hypothetical protein